MAGKEKKECDDFAREILAGGVMLPEEWISFGFAR